MKEKKRKEKNRKKVRTKTNIFNILKSKFIKFSRRINIDGAEKREDG